MTLPIIFRGHKEAGFFAHAVGLSSETSPLVVLPGNERTAETRYACIIVVKDYFRAGTAPRTQGEWHYSDIEPEILSDVRAHRAVLVFDLSNEGPAYDRTIFGPLYAWIEHNKLPEGRCIWLDQNRLMGVSAAAHVGPRAALIQFVNYDYFVKLMAWRFSQATSTEFLGNNPQLYLDNLLNGNDKDKLLLCLNATPRLGRTLAVAALYHHRLLNYSLVSYPGLKYIKAGAGLSDVLTFLDNNPSLSILRADVHAVAEMIPLRVDEFQEKGNELVERIDRRVYERTYFSLVTESDFVEEGIARVTEKTIKAFCMGHMALVLGNPGSIAILRSFGFKDWINVVDRAADSVMDPAARFEATLGEVLRQTDLIKYDPQAWFASVREISVYNHEYAVSGAFLAHYVYAYDQRLVSRMFALVNS